MSPWPRRGGPQPAGFARHSQSVTFRASARDVAIAKKLLRAGALPPRDLALIRLRLDHPEWNWRQIGEAAGTTKNQAAGQFRRLAERHGLR